MHGRCRKMVREARASRTARRVGGLRPACLFTAGGRKGTAEGIRVRFGELGARGSAVRAAQPPVLVQAGAKPHLPSKRSVCGETGAFAPASAEPAVVHSPLAEDIRFIGDDALPRAEAPKPAGVRVLNPNCDIVCDASPVDRGHPVSEQVADSDALTDWRRKARST